MNCPNCHAAIPDPTMRFCAWCGMALPTAERREGNEGAARCAANEGTSCGGKEDRGISATQGDRQGKPDPEKCARVVLAVLWFVLPLAGGITAACHGVSFWLGFLLGGLANGILRFLAHPFGL